MNFIHIADSHLDAFQTRTYGQGNRNFIQKRTDEIFQNLHQVIDYACDYNVKAIIHSGDVFDRPSPSKEYVKRWYEIVTRCQKEDKDLIIAVGNHDVPVSYTAKHALYTLQDIHVPNIYISDRPELIQFDDFEVYNIPWMWSKKEQNRNQLDNILQDLTVHDNLVLNCHCSIEGMFDNQSDFTLNSDHFYPFEYVALGHIHTPHWVAPNAYYPGSGTILNWGEADDAPHGFNHYNEGEVFTIPFDHCRPHLDIEPFQIPYQKNKDLSETLVRIRGKRSNYNKQDVALVASCFHLTTEVFDEKRERPYRSFIDPQGLEPREVLEKYLEITNTGTDHFDLLSLFDEIC